MFDTAQRVCHCTNSTPAPTPAPTTDVTYTTVVWAYEWPTQQQQPQQQPQPTATDDDALDQTQQINVLKVVERMGREGFLNSAEEGAAVRAVLADGVDSKAARLLTALLGDNADADDVTVLRRTADMLRHVL